MKFEIDMNNSAGIEKQLPKELKSKNTFSNRIFTEVDKAMLRLFKAFILFFVRKYKFRRNKYKILLLLRQFNVALFLVTVFVLTPIGFMLLLKKDNSFDSISFMICSIMLLPFAFIIFIEIVECIKTKVKAIEYEPLFLMQKHPQIYFGVKRRAKLEFVIDKKWRLRLLKYRLLTITFFITFFSFLWSVTGIGLEDSFILPIIVFHFISVIDDYIAYIFDFDKPDGKRKEAKREVTELMRRFFENLTRAMQPSASPI